MIHILLGSDDTIRTVEHTHEDNHHHNESNAPVRTRIEIEDSFADLVETWSPGQRSTVYEVVR